MSLRSKLALWRTLDPSLLLGLAGTALFYTVVLQSSMSGTALQRYTTEHAVEYVIVTFFIWGLMDVGLKLFRLVRERLALRHEWLPVRQGREPATQANHYAQRISQLPNWLKDSKMARRLTQALNYVTDKGTADEYREHLQYLADQDDDHTHASYAVIRFVMGASPVLGFLGTVIHFGTALSGNSFDDLADRLPTVVSEMGAAFNTTTVALAAAMSMMFSLFICERLERSLLRAIDRYVERELVSRFEIKDPNLLPFLSVLQSAQQEALAAIGTTLQGQVELWSRSLDGLFRRFEERQQKEIVSWQSTLSVMQQRHETYDNTREARLAQTLKLVDEMQNRHLVQLDASLQNALSLKSHFEALTRAIEGLSHGEGRLAEQQQTLTDNLRILRETSQIDQAMHGLTAAIHLLTARHSLSSREAA